MQANPKLAAPKAGASLDVAGHLLGLSAFSGAEGREVQVPHGAALASDGQATGLKGGGEDWFGGTLDPESGGWGFFRFPIVQRGANESIHVEGCHNQGPFVVSSQRHEGFQEAAIVLITRLVNENHEEGSRLRAFRAKARDFWLS